MSTRRSIGLLGLGMVAIATLLAFTAFVQKRGNTEDEATVRHGSTVSELPGEPYLIRLSGFSLPLSPEQLVYRADGGFEGDVVSVSPARWSTPSGAPPEGWSPGKRLSQPEVIYHSVTIRVADQMFGEATKTANVAVLGGSVGAVSMAVEDNATPELAVGDHVALFVMKPAEGWRLGDENLGLLQGYVVRNGEAVSSAQPPIPFTELVERVRAELLRRAHGAVQPAD